MAGVQLHYFLKGYEAIDEESFGYLDLHTITTLIPRIGERLKFINKHNEFVRHTVCPPATLPTPDLPAATVANANPEMAALPNPDPEMPDATMMPVLQIVPVFDIRAVLSTVPEGRSIVESLDTDQLITGKERKAMVRILVSHLIERCGETPTAVMKIAMASALIHAFPCLNDDSGSGFQLRRSSRGPRPQREQDTVPSRIVIPAATISEERAVQFAEWLKNNSQPLAQVEAYMRDICHYRAGWIRAEHSKSIPKVLAMFPCLTTPGMIFRSSSQSLHLNSSKRGFLFTLTRSFVWRNAKGNSHCQRNRSIWMPGEK
ncbi:hypothetical protein CesoFtcFv8_004749 [Champsocephalus esox]|uniref:SAM domain-containing protein n=1 Tax=Champsocephalus esox TaxID=159716 RepID=A0AAN8CQN5_9TELE|nr:hypothetical protein CesoFtcFv8_004749 [Champsocephalus esox]